MFECIYKVLITHASRLSGGMLDVVKLCGLVSVQGVLGSQPIHLEDLSPSFKKSLVANRFNV